MIAIPDAMRTLLKSKVFVGENRPAAEVEITGVPSGKYQWETATDWKTPSTTYKEYGVSVAKKANGKLIVCNSVNNTIYEAECTNVDDLTGMDNSAYGWVSTGLSSLSHAWACVWNLDGGLYMTFSDAGAPSEAPARQLIYKSPSGNGGDWELYSTVQSLSYSPVSQEYASHALNLTGIPVVLDSGRWVMVAGKWRIYTVSTYTFFMQNAYIRTSDDNGITWTDRYMLSAYVSPNDYYGSVSKNIWVSPAGNLYACYVVGIAGAPFKLLKSTDNGTTWTKVWEVNAYDEFWNVAYYFTVADNKLGGFILLVGALNSGTCKAYNFADPDTDCTAYTLIRDLPDWGSFVTGGDNSCAVAIDNKLIYTRKYAVLGISAETYRLQVKSVDVDMTKGAASQATVVIDNKNGVYSPDKEGEWQEVIWPNTVVTVKLGYGLTQQEVFKGLIDTITMKAGPPQEIEFTCRDYLKLALDQLVRAWWVDHYAYTVEYQGQTAEYIFRDLAIKAGWQDEDVFTGISGITIESITFTHESYADAFQRLCELCGFEYYCDESGKLYFYYATDRQPAITAAPTVLTGTAYTAIAVIPAGHPMSDNSVIVTNSDGTVTYTKDIDYTVRLGGSTGNAAICRTAGSTIPSGATVLVSCVYAAWVFREGEDIFSLDYTISDQDVYDHIIVISQDADGVFCRGDVDGAAADYYNILGGKVLIVEAGDLASSNAQCLSIAERTDAASLTKVRQASFSAVGNPYIQVGDCIQVIESSSTISEIYRVFSLRHIMSATDGFRTELQTYHYGYAPI